MSEGPRLVGRPPGPSRPDTARIYELMKENCCDYHTAYGIFRREQAAAGIRAYRVNDPRMDHYFTKYPGISTKDARTLALADLIIERWKARNENVPPPGPVAKARRKLREARLLGDLNLIERAAEELRLAQEANPDIHDERSHREGSV